jgi:hypothetical protein
MYGGVTASPELRSRRDPFSGKGFICQPAKLPHAVTQAGQGPRAQREAQAERLLGGGPAKRSVAGGAPGMGNRQEVTNERRKSIPGALTKGTRHRRDKGTDLEYQAPTSGIALEGP